MGVYWVDKELPRQHAAACIHACMEIDLDKLQQLRLGRTHSNKVSDGGVSSSGVLYIYLYILSSGFVICYQSALFQVIPSRCREGRLFVLVRLF